VNEENQCVADESSCIAQLLAAESWCVAEEEVDDTCISMYVSVYCSEDSYVIMVVNLISEDNNMDI